MGRKRTKAKQVLADFKEINDRAIATEFVRFNFLRKSFNAFCLVLCCHVLTNIVELSRV